MRSTRLRPWPRRDLAGRRVDDVLGVGVLGAPPLVAQLPWTGGALPGTRALFQAVTFDPIAGMAISNPSLLLLP